MKAKVFRSGFALTALLLAWFMLPGPTRAADKYWIGSDAGYWDNRSNWSLTDGGSGGAGQPQTGDDVYLTRSLAGGDLTVQYRNALNPNDRLGALYIFGFGSGLLTLDQSSGDTLNTNWQSMGGTGFLACADAG